MDIHEKKDGNRKEVDTRDYCKYGSKCFQKNPDHHKKFRHPPGTKILNEIEADTSKKRRLVDTKLSSSVEVPKAKKPHTTPISEKVVNTKIEKPKTEVSKTDISKTEVTKTEVSKTEVSKIEVSKTEVSKTKVLKIDASKTEVPKTEVPKIDVQKSEVPKIEVQKSEVPKSKVPKSEVSKSDVPKSEVSKSDVPKSDVPKSELHKSKVTKSEVTKSEVTKSDVPKSEVSKSDVPKSDVPKSDVPKSEVHKSKVTKSEVTKSEVTKSDVPKSEVSKSEVPKSEVPKSGVTKTEVSKTEVSKTQEKKEDLYAEARKIIARLFLVTMPNDFYKLYDFCNEVKPSDPSTAFTIVDIKLVGPYDVLNGLITKNTAYQEKFLTHWRYYYDPPEFQTILKGNDKEELHFGYWRDRPSSEPIFVAQNSSSISHKIKPVAENVFGAVASYLEERVQKANPFEKTGISNLLGKLKNYAKRNDITLETQTPKMKSREKNVVARTIHGAGIVCPYNKKSQVGYRELSVTDNQLLKIVKKIDDAKDEQEQVASRSELSEVVRLATIAGDECDFGTCLELGHDLLSTGCVHVQNAALGVLSIAYNQLDRQLFLKIVEAHLKNRKKGWNTSALISPSKDSTTE